MSLPPKIALVSVWFGPLPFWMPALLFSCQCNPDVDWLIFSDQSPPAGAPENVQFIPLARTAFNARASAALGYRLEVLASYAYKMCDLKIMYGRIFEPELRGYDFWGCCDMDVVWGQVRSFLTPELLANHDVITSRIGRISGHFCLFRNRTEWTDLFRRIPDVQARTEDSGKYRSIDEDGLTDLLQGYRRSRLRRFWARHIRKLPLPRVYWDRVLTTSGKHQRQMLADPSLGMRWCDGRVYGIRCEELMYLHFHELRQHMHKFDMIGLHHAERWLIDKHGILPEKSTKMKQLPLVSIVIPTYNRENMLIQALESAVSQTYRPIEIIVVDDGSTDGTDSSKEKAISDGSRNDVKIIWIRQENKGVAAARNTGIRNSTGKYLLFHDSDDILDKDKVRLQVDMLESLGGVNK